LQYLGSKGGNVEELMEILLCPSDENGRKREQGKKFKKPQNFEIYL
jgi:hypothetical protein